MKGVTAKGCMDDYYEMKINQSPVYGKTSDEELVWILNS